MMKCHRSEQPATFGYGILDDVALCEEKAHYVPEAETVRQRGISEARPLDFHSPYGLPALVFRMSCIYGAHQFGTEDVIRSSTRAACAPPSRDRRERAARPCAALHAPLSARPGRRGVPHLAGASERIYESTREA